jgi:apolipoprotein N-acyltransferase
MATKVQTTLENVVDWMRANSTPKRLPYLWLALGALLLALDMPRWTIPLTAWLYPIFFLRFARTQPLLRGMLLLFLATALVPAVALHGMIPFPPVFYLLEIVVGAIVTTLPYLIDRVLVPRLGGLLGTLVLPLAVTSMSYLFALLNSSSGTWGNAAYSQYGNLPLLQLLSVTGLWGIDFLLYWLASVVNWAWEQGFVWSRVRRGVVLYASLLALVLLFGSARLAIFPAPAQGSTVRVAGISPAHALIAAFDQQVSTSSGMQAMMSGGTQADRQSVRQAAAPVYEDLIGRSEQEARAGAKIILWPEGAVTVLQEDEASLLARASTLARATGTYLDLGVVVLLAHPVHASFAQNESILIDPTGRVVWRYQKAHPVPGEPFAPGDGKVPTVQTPYGRLATVICFDADFPGTLRQAGQAGATVLLVPSNDWREIDPYHTRMATYRAIENGYSLVRQTSHGLAMTVDYEGQVLASTDFYTTDPQVMVAAVPKQGVHTFYATIGDLFAWLCMLGLLGLIGVIVVRQRQGGATVPNDPAEAPPPVS